jgi:multimeric flavodoxin WrbA
MIVTPVNWYQVSAPIKLMMDRLVCANGGNPDPTLTQGKDARQQRRSSCKGGIIRVTSPADCFQSLCMVMSRAYRMRRSLSDW